MTQIRDANAIRALVPLWELVVWVVLIVLSGFGLSYVLFYFTTAEINTASKRQIEAPVIRAVARVQMKVNATHEVLQAIQHVTRLTSRAPGGNFDELIEEINTMQVSLAGVYLARRKNSRFTVVETLYRNKTLPQPQFKNDFPEFETLAAHALAGQEIVSGVWRGGVPELPEDSHLMLVTPCSKTDVNCVLLVLLPMKDMLSGLNELVINGLISGYTVHALPFGGNTKLDDTQLVYTRGSMRRVADMLGVPPVTHDNVVFKDQVWRFMFTASPRAQHRFLELLPYITLFISFGLTAFFVFYITGNHEYRNDAARLTNSLFLSNEELKEKIRAEEVMARALHDSEQRYRNIFENAGIGICQIDLTGNWINANRIMALMLGYADVKELLAQQPDAQQRLFVDTAARQNFFGGLGHRSQSDFETSVRRKDNNIVWVNMRGHVVYDEILEPLYYECTMYDVTRRRLTERALIAAKEQADFANRSKSEFLANMSHELRTPLNAIIGFSEIIKNQMLGPEGVTQYVEYAKDIYDSGELLLSLINDILDMSKIEAGKRALSETTFDIGRVIQSCVRLVAGRAKAGRLQLTIQIPKDLPPLRAEERAIKQVLTNLMTNAIKFTPEEGEVRVSAKIDTFGHLCIAIADTGIGIAAEDIPMALAPFGQIESSLSRTTQGTGLGLPLTKALIELHGGELQIESAVGRGTTAMVVLPADRVILRPV
ncbi:MAG: ATP-binding protein [Alphaproteobacteria bacterium]